MADRIDAKIYLNELIGRLSEPDQRVIRRKYVDGLTDAEVAKSMNLTVSNVQHIGRRAVRRLRQLVQEHVRAT